MTDKKVLCPRLYAQMVVTECGGRGYAGPGMVGMKKEWGYRACESLDGGGVIESIRTFSR